MPTRRIEYVDQPLVLPRVTPDTRTLGNILRIAAQQQAETAMQQGQNSGRMWSQMGELFNRFQQGRQQKAEQAKALEIRSLERAMDEKLKRDEMSERAAERKEAQRLRQEGVDRDTAVYTAENTTPGPINRFEAEILAKFPGTAARVRGQQTLPATVTQGAMGSVSQTPESFDVLEPSPQQTRQAQIDAAARERERQMAANRAEDNRRQGERDTATAQDRKIMQGIAQQNANTSRMQAETTQRRYGNSGVELTGLPPEYADALDSALMTFAPTRRGPVVAQAMRAVGDPARLAEVIQQATLAGENVDARNQVNGRRATLAALKDARNMIKELKASGVPTGWMTGTAEDLMRKIGQTTDPRLVSLKARLMDSMIQYRRAATGVQFSERESRDYQSMFPNYSQSFPVNEAAIDGLSRAMASNDRSYWVGRLGKKGAALVLGPDGDQKVNPNR